jgi:hypothetical protein
VQGAFSRERVLDIYRFGMLVSGVYLAFTNFCVQTQKEENSKISEHIHRTGYHFREVIVDEAREIVGETVVVSQPRRYGPGEIEPIPESQEEINKQADGAIRDLFPRIPNIDRTMIIEHAFKKVSFVPRDSPTSTFLILILSGCYVSW